MLTRNHTLLKKARASQVTWVALSLGAALPCVACNAILGIEEPPDGLPGSVIGDEDGGLLDGSSAGPGTDGAVGDAGRPIAVEHAFATWPMPNPEGSNTAHAFDYSASSAELVVDGVTGLNWQRVVPSESYAWEDAKAYCRGQMIAGKPLRLPTRIELLSLLDPTRVLPAIDPGAFPGTPSEPFWSASPFVGLTAAAWSVDFGYNTNSVFSHPTTARLRVRCVQDFGAPDGSGEDVPVIQGGTTSYAKTGVTWQTNDAPDTMDWDSAVQYCAALDLDGPGWRLPTLKELHLLVDETRTLPAIQAAMSLHEGAELAWSATNLARFPRSAWALNSASGTDLWLSKSGRLAVRCVR